MIRLDGQLHIKSPTEQGYWLLSEIYPEQKHRQLIEYNQTVDFLLDGQSATVSRIAFSLHCFQTIGGWSEWNSICRKQKHADDQWGRWWSWYRNNRAGPCHYARWTSNWNGYIEWNEKRFEQVKEVIILVDALSFPGQYLPRSAPIMNTSIAVSDLLLQQFIERQEEYPIAWTDDELAEVAWLGPHRLLLFVCVLNPDDRWNVTAQINNVPVVVHKGYNTRDTHNRDRFMGFYLDLTDVVQKPNTTYSLFLEMPPMNPGQFQGLFLENIERILVEA